MKESSSQSIALPEGVSGTYTNNALTIVGSQGSLTRVFAHPGIIVTVKDSNVQLSCEKTTKRERKIIFTIMSHIKNMIAGVQKAWRYELKICASHFPMNVTLKDNSIVVKNFLGEKTPRSCSIPEGVTVKIEGTTITVESIDLEKAGNVAGKMELITTVSGRDRRVFQDGIYITKKGKQR